MFFRAATRSLSAQSRQFSSSAARQSKVAVLGAGGGIGQPLSLLLKLNPLVTELSLYDIRGAPGVAADVSHIDSKSEVHGYPADKLDQALEGTDVVVIPAGVPRKPGMTRDDLFNTNASIVRDLAAAIARVSPKAHILVISNPVNSTVPIVSAVLEKAGVYDPAHVFGVTTLDVVRAQRFLAGIVGADPKEVPVTVVGGHSGTTIVPLLSQTPHGKGVTGEAYKKLVHRIQFGGDEVVQAKEGAGSATLSMAYAGARFTGDLLRAINGEKGVVTPTFVKSPLFADQGIDFFSSNVELGPNGVEKILPLGQISAEEEELLAASLPELKKNIEKGKKFVSQS
ncbi:malate dehydrogenase [Dichomitus squalens]|uniref:Malate dehydrogenase n=1 Tax=Dichomitus squalens TaxID=114155 RepID=A0A4Q9ML56_9APHY|nr:malate dehydrogenase [Dichomitus squalens LYAD-421 SS1]EJF63144.1 malate dehydrogenase [Dichomitus squalens LYAD-421 SS1]TBU27747.1 malate dehydrogenase [Dichomitus squalens]TBU37996.1 malate dehydrogenase [Dichomitus squalens]TBU61195.1 malate dehydrogenase [Dichomitus squalens]